MRTVGQGRILSPEKMSEIQEFRRRLADLIWRTVKLRILILTLSIIALLVVWSALLTGNQQASKIDIDFCRVVTGQENQIKDQIWAEYNAAHLSAKPISSPAYDPDGMCTALSSRKWIETLRSMSAGFIPIDHSQNLSKLIRNLEGNFPKYDAGRLAAYGMKINLSSEFSGSTVEGNTLAIAEILPFCIILALVVVLILGFQEREYRRNLRSILTKVDGLEYDQALAEGQFFARSGRFHFDGPGRFLVLAPERIIVGALLVSVVALLLKVVSLFLGDLLHLTDTIFFSYPFRLYAAVVLGVAVVLQTWRSYRSPSPPHFLRWPLPQFIEKWGPIFFVTCAYVCFAAPWAVSGVGKTIRGYEFGLSDPVTYALGIVKVHEIDRRIFAEIRLQVWIAIGFLVLSTISALNRIRPLGEWVNFARAGSRVMSALVFFLALNYLIYMGILQYEAIGNTPWLDQGFTLQANGMYTMMFYDPCFGFWGFLICCSALIWFSFRSHPVNVHPGEALVLENVPEISLPEAGGPP